MKSSKKLYLKALNEYNKGYIDRALQSCEESISINMNNSAAINLKGLLLYLKGDLKGAKALWQMNIHVNKDSVSKKYLQDSSEDNIRNNLFESALELIKEGKINNAITTLNKCRESDFNYIDVNNYLSICYISKEEYSKAKIHIDKVLGLDKKNKLAIQNNKKLYSLGKIKNPNNKKLIISLVSGICVISLIVISIGTIKNKGFFKKAKSTSVNLNKENNKKDIVEKKKTKEDKNLNNINKVNENKDNKLKDNELKDYISKKDYEKIYIELNKVDVNKISINEKFLYNQGKELLEKEGVEYFYNKGISYLEKKEYKKSNEYLIKSYNFGKKTWVYPHNIYMLGLCNEGLGNIEEAIKYYEIYDNNFKNNSYSDAVLYNLSILYKNIDINNSKIYGKKLIDNYPNSIYNNSNIRNILNK
ncbi:hypothetical protein DP149_11170 [Clostridium tetani]|uniref:Conserved protein n=1 Tax=Clostridium tetani (strain Massachusetts / E88) TaxID=212717 RepID=Q890T1_CLOTE|nr:tetratricopeptide repeat protein [Clostridium tetani]AAO37014.1 conserved protein [Clostridium tetani E88]AVP54680.1 hypothetical protein C3B72_05875 [Clostridium tetani]KGI38706.1 hypothetical protein KY52_06095 [Clostridium tetani]KGI44051.1 hypothetical protein KY54_08305 [Clostridium tetani]KHO31022.1 hypothetical protein OR63_12915 [Clostridium tetani]